MHDLEGPLGMTQLLARRVDPIETELHPKRDEGVEPLQCLLQVTHVAPRLFGKPAHAVFMNRILVEPKS
jgi:hypothetical protein